jgi:EAL domain-containing protein (putative c-di-GMP-specific phosphodiesterase class I)/PAS domain-containing protein
MLLSGALSLALGAALLATIYFTLFDWQWLAFLGGVLFAAVLALVSRASQAEWRLLRRSKQFERVRQQLAEETARSHNADHALRAVEKRMLWVHDWLPIPFLYADGEGRCHYHNRACAEWLGLAAERISGRALAEIFGQARYPLIAPEIARTLSGKAVEYDLAWPGKDGAATVFKVRQVPYSPNGGGTIGFYLMATPAAARRAAAGAPAQAGAIAEGAAGENSEALYLRSLTEELMVGVDPRERIVQALQRDEFLLFAQKLLPLSSGMPEPECYEVLLRLKEEEENLLPPGSFIPVAEHYGMLEDIDRWVLRSLIAFCLEKRRATPGWRIPLFAINVSGHSAESAGFASFVQQELERSGFPARALCLEFSEPDMIRHNDGVRRLMAALRTAGCRFSIDNFRGAAGSFSHLNGLAVDFLKIDGSIIHNIGHDPAALAKTRAIHTVFRKAGVRSVAELVETRQTLDKLRGIGIDYVQGFGISPPAAIAKVLP